MDANYKDPTNYTSDIDYTQTQFLDKLLMFEFISWIYYRKIKIKIKKIALK